MENKKESFLRLKKIYRQLAEVPEHYQSKANHLIIPNI